ncbi:MAG: LTA synthase family protein, partial [Oscillospiraceae bacterium]|nr:LTA synthase family protein [Oscillospiraceae bacterium]
HDIPADRRVNIVALQLESFCDLGVMGFTGIDENTNAVLHRLQEEALSGTMIAHVTGGGTCTSEYCFLTGTYGGLFYHYDAPTYVRYFNDQGYMTTGGHPNKGEFYNRVWVSRYFGFQEYLTLENYYRELTNGRWQCDDVLLPDVFSHYKELAEDGQSVFSFTVTLQGHGAYRADEYRYDAIYWPGEGCSESSRCVVNNYLGSVAQTQELLWEQLELLRDDPTPVVVLLYGDHTPFLTSQQVYDEAGVSFDLSTEDGMRRYYGTPYVIWANDAAKAVTGRTFSGDGPTISPGYLMNVLFDAIGWEGDAFMQYTNSVMRTLPVASTRGFYVENGVYTRELSPAGAELLHEYRCVQHYYHDLLIRQR